jgi:Flavodoxin domain
MRALVVYESMYGNTRQIAEAIARGLRSAYAVQVVSVASAPYEHVGRYDLVVVGGPTHARGMSRPDTRQSAMSAPGVQSEHPRVEPGAGGMGLRVWLDSLGLCSGQAAAFDTRLNTHALLTGRGLQRHRLHAASAWVPVGGRADELSRGSAPYAR